MGLLAVFLGVDPDLLRLITAILGLIAASATATSTVLGFLNRRIRKRTEATAESTNVAVRTLIDLLAEQRTERDALWTAFLQKDTIANPEGVRRIATETATEVATGVADTALLPMRQFYAAVEIVENRREHRPETDLIRILQEEIAA